MEERRSERWKGNRKQKPVRLAVPLASAAEAYVQACGIPFNDLMEDLLTAHLREQGIEVPLDQTPTQEESSLTAA